MGTDPEFLAQFSGVKSGFNHQLNPGIFDMVRPLVHLGQHDQHGPPMGHPWPGPDPPEVHGPGIPHGGGAAQPLHGDDLAPNGFRCRETRGPEPLWRSSWAQA